MGYALNFVSLSWQEIWESLAFPSENFRRAVFDEQWSAYRRTEDSELVWSKALQELKNAIDKNSLAPVSRVTPSDEAALGFVCAVSHLGTLVGTLTHSSASGHLFTEHFLAQVASEAFNEPNLLNLFVSRPMFGLVAADFPSWGGLRKGEVSRLLQAYEKPVDQLNEDVESWLDDLCECLTSAAERRLDVITTYL
jgi:hypothetical protein